MNFSFLNFCTIYSSKGYIKKPLREDACFSTVFKRLPINKVVTNTYTIRLFKGNTQIEKNNNNSCFVDRRGIVNHLRVLKALFPFNYKLKEAKRFFNLTVTLKASNIYHKYLLSWIRYLYEYPYNMFLLDVHRLKKISKFKYESIINLFNLVGATSDINDHGTRIHAIGEIPEFKKLTSSSEIKAILDNNPNKLNNIFKTINNIKGLKRLQDDYDDLHTSEYWESEEKFQERLDIYISNYKKLKTIK